MNSLAPIALLSFLALTNGFSTIRQSEGRFTTSPSFLAGVPSRSHQFVSSNAILTMKVEDDEIGRLPLNGDLEKRIKCNEEEDTSSFISRRLALRRFATISAVTAATVSSSTSPFMPSVALAATDEDLEKKVHISASWKAVDGLNSLDKENNFVSFDLSAYKAMVGDASRTPFFEKAIIQRLNSVPGGPESQVVLDLGTGPFAFFAILAAQAGAGKVYAIEASKEAAKSARVAVKQAGFEDVIEIVEGFSTEITLPQKVDFAVAEIIGSVATEEGAYGTILDAHNRFLKEPNKASNWIPSRIQTYAAPASYTLHNLFQPPAFDWTKLNGEPVRFNCRDEGLQLLSDPQLVEDILFADITNSKYAKTGNMELKFVIDEDRIKDNQLTLFEEFRKNRLGKGEAEKMAKSTGQSLSGIALWPRLLLDGDEKIQVNSRSYPNGGHQKSHWQTVLPIMAATPVSIKGGDEVIVNVDFDVPSDVLRPPSYKLDGEVVRT
uniref:Methyltransferase domain-containing protein n=1 Tax=Ditylum brightwellii TaxID=49249 RepID=A0A7S2EUK9_9STRA